MSSFDPSGLVVYVDGEYVDGADARLSIFDHGAAFALWLFAHR